MDHHYEGSYQNISLRPLAQEDIESLRSWRNDPDNTAFLRKLPYITSSMQQEWFGKYLQDPDEMIFAIVETAQLKRLIGSLSLYHFHEKDCEFGKILIGDPDAHSRKAGLNATIAAVTIAFEQLKKEQVYLQVYEDNSKAVTVYNNAGFSVSDCHKDENGLNEYTMIVRKGQWQHA